MKKLLEVQKLKKFDIVELVCGPKTIDYLLMYKGSNMCRIYFMDKTSIFCLTNEIQEVKRDNFYALTHKVFSTNIINVLQ